ncbi:MAG: C4-dicarboxylate ABC transporter permease [Clostridiaceae bacterium BRH_c20a]|nr:MAG: C4-dicarboxylate ABC transporter permease [Clostridiaceae bacterium BRH_c20a]
MTSIALVLIITFIICLVLSIPLGFTLGITAMVVTLFKGSIPLIIIPQRALLGADSVALTAVPFFILAGHIMNQGGITVRLVNFTNVLVGRLRGGLALANVVSCMIFAGISGSAVAESSGVGSVLIPAMKKEGYDADFSAAVTASASICGPIIPPSVPMVIYGINAGVSIGAMFLAGAIPGIILGLSLALLTYYYSIKRNYPKHGSVTLNQAWKEFVSAIWALIMPVIILGGIFSGVFTVTESAAVAVVYAVFIAKYIYKDIAWNDLPNLIKEAAIDTAVIMFIIAIASLFGWTMAITRLPHLLTEFIFSLDVSVWVILLFLNIFLLFVGTFMEAISAMVILIPLLLGPAKALGIDPIHLGVILVFNLMLGLLTPPVGLCLYITGRIARVSLEDVVKASFPFLVVGIIVLMIVTYVPDLILFLPRIWMN